MRLVARNNEQTAWFAHRKGHYAARFLPFDEIPRRWYVRQMKEKTSENAVFAAFRGLKGQDALRSGRKELNISATKVVRLFGITKKNQ